MGLLTTAEQNLLIDLLIDLDGLSDTNARLTLIRGLPQQRKREVDLNGRVRIFVSNLVDALESLRLEDGSWPIALVIEEAIKWTKGSLLAGQLDSILATARARPPQPLPALALPPNVEPYDTCMVINAQPFVDRAPLRMHLRNLVEQGLPALVVTGQPDTGSSYTYELIKFLWELKRIPVPIYVDIEWYQRNAQLPVAVVKDLLTQLNLDGGDLAQQYGLSSLDHWTAEVGRIIFAHANREARRIWIILDNMTITQENDPVPEAGEALNKLAKVLVARAVKSLNLRVVLLGYPDAELGALESEVQAKVGIDYVPAVLTAVEVERFFADHLQRSNRADRLPEIPGLLLRITQMLQSQDLAASRLWPEIHKLFPDYLA